MTAAAGDTMKYFLNFFSREGLTFHVTHLPSRWFTWNAKSYFVWKTKLKKKKSRLSSAAAVIGVSRARQGFVIRTDKCNTAALTCWIYWTTLHIGVISQGNVSSDMCSQQRLRSPCSSSQSDQNLCWLQRQSYRA